MDPQGYHLTDQAAHGAIVVPSSRMFCEDLIIIDEHEERYWMQQDWAWADCNLANHPPQRPTEPHRWIDGKYPVTLKSFYHERITNYDEKHTPRALKQKLWRSEDVWAYFPTTPAIQEWLKSKEAKEHVPYMKHIWISVIVPSSERPEPMDAANNISIITFGDQQWTTIRSDNPRTKTKIQQDFAPHSFLERYSPANVINDLYDAGASHATNIAITWLEWDESHEGPFGKYRRHQNLRILCSPGQRLHFDLVGMVLRRFEAPDLIHGHTPYYDGGRFDDLLVNCDADLQNAINQGYNRISQRLNDLYAHFTQFRLDAEQGYQFDPAELDTLTGDIAQSFATLHDVRATYPNYTNLNEFMDQIEEHEHLWGLDYDYERGEIARPGQQMINRMIQIKNTRTQEMQEIVGYQNLYPELNPARWDMRAIYLQALEWGDEVIAMCQDLYDYQLSKLLPTELSASQELADVCQKGVYFMDLFGEEFYDIKVTRKDHPTIRNVRACRRKMQGNYRE